MAAPANAHESPSVLPPPESLPKNPENGTEHKKGPGEKEMKMAGELQADMNKPAAEVIMDKLEKFGFGGLVDAFTHKGEPAPQAQTEAPLLDTEEKRGAMDFIQSFDNKDAAPQAKSPEAPAPAANNAAEIGDDDFDAIKGFAKPAKPVPVPPPPTEQAKPASHTEAPAPLAPSLQEDAGYQQVLDEIAKADLNKMLGGKTPDQVSTQVYTDAIANPQMYALQDSREARAKAAYAARNPDRAKAYAEQKPQAKTENKTTTQNDQGPLDHTVETNSFILEEERRRQLGIPWDKWQQYKKDEVAQAQQKMEDDKRAAETAVAQAQRNEQVKNMMDATQANIDAAGAQRRTEAAAPFVNADKNTLSPEDDAARRNLGMSVQEYTNYQAAVQKEQQNRADTAAQEAKQKLEQQADQKRQQESQERAAVGFQPRTTGDTETDALGQEIVAMQQRLQQLKAGGGNNANTIASSEGNLQVQIDAAIKKWKKMENDAYWKKKNAEPKDNFRGFKLKAVGEGLTGQASSTVNTGELQQAADWAREQMKGKTEEEQKKIKQSFDARVQSVIDIDNQQDERRQQRAQREAQAQQDALNPDEVRQRARQEAMAEWTKQNPEPTDSPLEHANWMKKLASKNAELDAADLEEAKRRQEIKAKAEAAEPENFVKADAPAVEAPLTGEAAMAAEIAELKAKLAERDAEDAEVTKMLDENPALVDALPEPLKSKVKDKKKYSRLAVILSVASVAVIGLASSAGKVATTEMGRTR